MAIAALGMLGTLVIALTIDAYGPSLNILIKLSAILPLVFVPFFVQYGGILLKFM